MPQHRLEVKQNGDTTVVSFVEKRILDEETIHVMGEHLIRLVDSGRRKIYLDFSNVEFLRSPVFGILIALHKKLQAVEGNLTLCNVNSDIYELLERTRLDSFFNIQRGSEDDGARPSTMEGRNK
jgi:anti-sigma B factor antagonist